MPLSPSTTPLRAILTSDPLALLTGLGMDPGPELGPGPGVDSIVTVSTGLDRVNSGILLSSDCETSTVQIERNVRFRNSTYSGIAIELAGDLMAYQYLQLRGTHRHTDTQTDCCAPRHSTESKTATTSLLPRAISALTKQLRSACLTALLCSDLADFSSSRFPSLTSTHAICLPLLLSLSLPLAAPLSVWTRL